MSVQVLSGVASQWRDHVGDDVPIHAAGPWINATSHRLTRNRLTFLASAGGQNGGLQAAVVEDPAADEMINLYRTLLADPKVWKFPAASVAARAGLREQAAPVQDWLPQLVVMYPGFDTFVAASGCPAPALAETLVDGVLGWGAEMGGMNLFFVFGSGSAARLVTPPLTGTLLPGITRDSLLTLTPDMGFPAAEDMVSAAGWRAGAESGEITEVFACGTAAVITPVGKVRSAGGDWVIGDGAPGPVTMKLREALLGIQYGTAPDPYGWVRKIC